MVKIRVDEGEQRQPNLLWDSVWSPPDGMADWAIAGPSEIDNKGGLQARAALHTAIIICLFTDKRMPEKHPLEKYLDDGDRRGWFGDVVDVRTDLFEEEMGSLLWIFERVPLTEEIRKSVEAEAQAALSPLIKQGAAVEITASAVASFASGRVDLTIEVFGRNGQKTYDYRFDDIWQQTATAPPPRPFPQYPA